jgi:hypothetical protein
MNIRNVFILTIIPLSSVQLYGMNNNTINPYGWNKTKPNDSLSLLLPNTGPNNINILKRTSETNIISPSPDKKTRTESPQGSESLLFVPNGITQGDPLANNPLENEQIMQIDPITVKPQNTALQPSPFALTIKKSIYNIDPIGLGNLLISNEVTQLSKEEKEDLYKFAREKKHLFKAINDFISETDRQELKTKYSSDDEYKNLQKMTRNLYALKTLPKLIFPQAFFTNTPYVKELLPKTTPDQALIALIKNEQEKISVCCFSFDLISIANALVNKKKDGILVEVITDKEQGQKPNALKVINLLRDNDIEVLSPQNKDYEKNHHKFSVFKRNLLNKPLLCNGSFNYSFNATKNCWEDMIISDDSEMIEAFDARFKEVKDRSTEFKFPQPIQQQSTMNNGLYNQQKK